MVGGSCVHPDNNVTSTQSILTACQQFKDNEQLLILPTHIFRNFTRLLPEADFSSVDETKPTDPEIGEQIFL